MEKRKKEWMKGMTIMYKNKWKKNMAVVMAGVIVSQAVVPAYAAESNEKETEISESVTEEIFSKEQNDSKETKKETNSTDKKNSKETDSKEAEKDSAKTQDSKETKKKEPTEKEEVVYANLDADGKKTGVYVVNIFNDKKDIVDYGTYSNIRNMNTTDKLTDKDGVITATTDQKSLYYEGTLEKSELPWDISMEYQVDNKKYSASEMAGKSGALDMKMNIKPNKKAKEEFRKGYTLQITIVMDGEHCENIQADGATIANVGKDKQLTYIIFPDETKTLEVKTDITNFEMSAVAINGVKMQLGIDVDSLESDELKNKVIELQNGTKELDDGAKSASTGSQTLQNGAAKVQEGIASMQNGLNQLNANSASLVSGSAQVNQALQTINASLSGISSQSPQDLLTASSQIRDAIGTLESSLATLSNAVNYEAYKAAFQQQGIDLDQLMTQNAQAGQQLQQAASSLAGVLPQDQAAMLSNIGQLLAASNGVISGTKTYLDTASQNINAVHNGSAQLKQSYETYYNAISGLVQSLSGMMGNVTTLTNSIQTLASQYATFDTGIQNYTGAVVALVNGCNELSGGMQELVSGCNTLADGTKKLSDGTGELKDKTSNLEEEMKDMITKEFDSKMGNDVKNVSFVSDKNKNVKNVQFVIQTEAIKMKEQEVPKEQEQEKIGLWQKFLNLFGIS